MSVVPKDQLKPQAGDDAEEAVWFQVKKKKLSDSENGATYALTIENDERSIFIGYRITETYEQKGLMWHRDVQADLLPAIDAPEDEALIMYTFSIRLWIDWRKWKESIGKA